MPNNSKTTNHLQAKRNETTNSLQQEKLLAEQLKTGEATAKPTTTQTMTGNCRTGNNRHT